jgi:cytosine permease
MRTAVLRRHREERWESARSTVLPARQEQFNPVTLVAWTAAAIVGYAVHWGIPALNSLICAAVLYYVGMKVLALAQCRDRVVFPETAT